MGISKTIKEIQSFHPPVNPAVAVVLKRVDRTHICPTYTPAVFRHVTTSPKRTCSNNSAAMLVMLHHDLFREIGIADFETEKTFFVLNRAHILAIDADQLFQVIQIQNILEAFTAKSNASTTPVWILMFHQVIVLQGIIRFTDRLRIVCCVFRVRCGNTCENGEQQSY
ncbi:uncharacterized protein SPPG_09523 [Spizellomyces punctatus DAOM BR117]|uniref:Uncharacterized protein n=1 Tax=Spizellomyces punctatus (strain DAOM BR117) TaxID=645134 RepID=A0A0L0H6F3_SPIPD|nr:uncharacterized protein SPPG_09523 [Spizellomyces punctatus DAOM BR117]KNC96303.1 hypothetical protein SPPG_09523 [Spizellomyces punctatus DAOM BR117]|eukprot:XP_016604343.1 hypothetical protein SPPG_09523 [Spizellomyces punctatus DAOM BR117]